MVEGVQQGPVLVGTFFRASQMVRHHFWKNAFLTHF